MDHAKARAETRAAEKAEPDDFLFRFLEAETHVQPTPLAGGPWNPDHQHGGAVSGLLARALDRIEAPCPMRLSRMTLEMFRAVPLTPLRIETRVVRGGRRIQSVEAGLFDGETQVARATGLRIRRDASLAEMAAGTIVDPEVGRPPNPVPPSRSSPQLPTMPGFIRAVDFVRNPEQTCGEPSYLWTRLVCRLVEGEETSPVAQLATLVDFTSGTGNGMDYSRFTSINPDLTIHVLREPRSDWIVLRGITLRAEDGIGQSSATVFDEEGPIAQVQASLLLGRR